MSIGLLSQIEVLTLILALGVATLSGVIKGAVGFGMPLVIVSGLSTFLDPKIAIAGIIAPIVLSNALQTFRTGIGPAIEGVKYFWRYVLVVCIAIFVAAQVVPSIPSKALYFVLGIPVFVLSLIQIMGLRLHIPPQHRGWSEWVVGLISGTLGGLTGTWGPTTVLYLLAKEGLSMFDWPSFAEIATALGGQGVKVSSPEELETAINAIKTRQGPLLIELSLDPNDVPRMRI